MKIIDTGSRIPRLPDMGRTIIRESAAAARVGRDIIRPPRTSVRTSAFPYGPIITTLTFAPFIGIMSLAGMLAGFTDLISSGILFGISAVMIGLIVIEWRRWWQEV